MARGIIVFNQSALNQKSLLGLVFVLILILLLVYKTLEGLSPEYLPEMLTEIFQTTKIVDILSKNKKRKSIFPYFTVTRTDTPMSTLLKRFKHYVTTREAVSFKIIHACTNVHSFLITDAESPDRKLVYKCYSSSWQQLSPWQVKTLMLWWLAASTQQLTRLWLRFLSVCV